MIAAHTNVLIRLVMADDASQAAGARQVFDEAADRDGAGCDAVVTFDRGMKGLSGVQVL